MAITPQEGSQDKHPTYTALAAQWQMALDVYEGLGGFLDESKPYLIPHPREWLDHSIRVPETETSPATMVPNPKPVNPSPKLVMRRKLARYENVAEAILNQMMSALFLQPPARTWGQQVANQTIVDWWKNVDGIGTAMTDFMRLSELAAAVFGHCLVLADKVTSTAQTAAEAKAPLLRRYTPLDLIDWLTDDNGNLTAVKVLEQAPRASFAQKANSLASLRVRVVTTESWALFDGSGKLLDGGDHGFGVLPATIHYGKRRPFTPIIGKPIMGDPKLFIDLYNLVSEVRELLRNQTFGILNVPVGAQGSVEREMSLLGSQSGTSNVMFSTAAAQYIQPDAANVTIYHEHIDRLARMIYRLASAPWESDSKDAEAADSRRLRRQEQNQALVNHAAECQRVDLFALEMAYRSLYGPDVWQKRYQADQPTVAYSTDFEPPDYEALATEAADALTLELGPTATKEIKKRFVRVRLRDLDSKTQHQVDTEIDGQEILTAIERQQQMLDAAASRLARPIQPGKPAQEAA